MFIRKLITMHVGKHSLPNLDVRRAYIREVSGALTSKIGMPLRRIGKFNKAKF
jgi:hypothetical protein